MTIETSGALPRVAGAAAMLVIHVGLIVFVAENAFENCKVG